MNCCPGSMDYNAEGENNKKNMFIFMIYELQKSRNIHKQTEQTAQSGNRSVNYCWISSLMNKYASSYSSIKHHLYNVHCFQKLSLSSSMPVWADMLRQGYLGFYDRLSFSTPSLSSLFPLNNHTLAHSPLSFLYLVFILKSSVFSFLFLSHILSLFSIAHPLISHLILLGEPEVVVGLQKLGVFCQLGHRDGGVTHHTCRGSTVKAGDQNRLKSPLVSRTMSCALKKRVRATV